MYADPPWLKNASPPAAVQKPRAAPKYKPGKHCPAGTFNPNSFTSQKLALRTEDSITPSMMARRDRYVDGLLAGMNKTDAALYAGFAPSVARREGSTLFREPYVMQRFTELREKLTNDQLLTRAELIINVKSIAFNDRVNALSRIAASQLLAKVMGYEAPAKQQVEFLGGVMIIPAPMSVDSWEQKAIESQNKLKEEVQL